MMNLCPAKIFMTFALLSAFVPRTVGQQRTAEQIFRARTGPGLKISIEMKRGDLVRSVPPDTTFVDGDKVKIHFTTNFDGYVYALNETPSGRTLVLFPSANSGTQNLVSAGIE